jgi:mannose-6-phosphate isomerase-like protein (cupin superfamily)
MTADFPSASEYAAEPVRHAPLVVVDVLAEQRAVTEGYRNVVLSRVNSTGVRLAVFEGEYRWHRHPSSDECFVVVEGRLEIDLADGRTLVLEPWQSVVIPAGTLHRTRAVGRTVNLTIEALGAETDFVDDPTIRPTAP